MPVPRPNTDRAAPPPVAALRIDRAALARRGLVAVAEATVLDVAERDADGREHRLEPAAAAAWRRLKAAAADDGVTLTIVSAFRSVERQAQIVQRKLDAGQPLDVVLRACAPPGYSEHHSGRAVDLSTPGEPPLDVAFARSAAFAWLAGRAGAFGFRLSYPQCNRHGFQYEPWHWCFVDASWPTS